MSGLDQMIQRIEAGAKAQASEILEEARQEAEKIAKDAEAERNETVARISQKAGQDAAAYGERLAASLEQQRRTALLSAKQALIAEALEKSYEALLALPADRYFGFLEKVFARYVQKGSGEILFSEKDQKRMPAGYLAKLQAVAKAHGGSISLSQEERPMDGGFILIYGGVEENCTIRALFDTRREALQDQIHRALFA